MKAVELLQQPNLNRTYLGQELVKIVQQIGARGLLDELTSFKGKLVLKGEDRNPFLLRIDLMPHLGKEDLGKFFLHVFFQSDGDGLHSHPTIWAYSKILAWGYEEFRIRKKKYLEDLKAEPEAFVRRPGDEVHFDFLDPNGEETIHKINRLLGPYSMSLFQFGPRKPTGEWEIILPDRRRWEMLNDSSHDVSFKSWKEVEHLLPDVF